MRVELLETRKFQGTIERQVGHKSQFLRCGSVDYRVGCVGEIDSGPRGMSKLTINARYPKGDFARAVKLQASDVSRHAPSMGRKIPGLNGGNLLRRYPILGLQVSGTGNWTRIPTQNAFQGT